MGRSKAIGKMTADDLNLGWAECGARSDDLGIAASIGAAGEHAAQRAANTAHKRTKRAGNNEAHCADAIALQRRKLGVKVVNPKPHRQRHIPSMEVRRAKHGQVSKAIWF
jgi:hypothetical protein